MNLNNRIALVTGAADGIGRASALEFARHGADVVMADVNVAGNQAAAAAITAETDRQALAVTCDVADDAQLQRLLDATLERFGRCDILLNNAGIIVKGVVLDLAPDDFDRVLNVNLRSYFVLTQLVSRHMVAKPLLSFKLSDDGQKPVTQSSCAMPEVCLKRAWLLQDGFAGLGHLLTFPLLERALDQLAGADMQARRHSECRVSA